jgi:hypothetical protein
MKPLTSWLLKFLKWMGILIVASAATVGFVFAYFAIPVTLADLGYPKFQYREGKEAHRTKDNYSAIKYYTKAATQGHLQAQLALAEMYENGVDGDTIDPDSETALKWYRMAADQGHANAQFKLASLMVQSEDFKIEEYPEVARYYGLAADQNLARAQAALGFLYVSGLGVKRDIGEAYYWLRLFKIYAKTSEFDAQYLQWIDEVIGRISRDLAPSKLKLIEERIQKRSSRS